MPSEIEVSPVSPERFRLVILHDPRTAGLVEAMHAAGASMIWRCHVGLDEPNDLAREAWDFLLPTSRRPMPTCSRASRSPGRAWTASASW